MEKKKREVNLGFPINSFDDKNIPALQEKFKKIEDELNKLQEKIKELEE